MINNMTYEEAYNRCLIFLVTMKNFDFTESDFPSVLSGVSAALALVYGKQTSDVGNQFLADLEE